MGEMIVEGADDGVGCLIITAFEVNTTLHFYRGVPGVECLTQSLQAQINTKRDQ